MNDNNGSREASKEVLAVESMEQFNNRDVFKGQVLIKIIGQQKRKVITVASHRCQINHHIRVKKDQ